MSLFYLVFFPVSAPLRPSTPEKFSVPHICARFGPGGYLIKVLPNLPSEGQPALVEIHSMEVKLKRKKGGRWNTEAAFEVEWRTF